MTQAQQTEVLLDEFDRALPDSLRTPVLLLAPETFTGDIVLNDPERSATVRAFRTFLAVHPGTELLFGASTYDIHDTRSAPSILSRPYGDGWIVSHNSALMARPEEPLEYCHKSKLVIGVEMTPWPKIFVPLDDWLSRKMGMSGLMGRSVGQDEPSVLHFGQDRIPVGCAVCYESVYPEYCTGYVKAGAKFMTIITNDAWWGDTPGYRQHLSYARLRAIELRRDIARCGNTGISCFIDQRGEILSQTDWWTRGTLAGQVNLNSARTLYVLHGDLVGRVCTLIFLLLAALLLVRVMIRR